MSPWKQKALVSLREELQLNVLMESGLGNHLEKAAGGFMTRFEARTVREQPGNTKQMDRVIELLLGKGDEDFTTFLKMMRDSNNKAWADELEKRAEQFKKEGMCVYRGRDQIRRACMQFSVHVKHTSPACPVCVYMEERECL